MAEIIDLDIPALPGTSACDTPLAEPFLLSPVSRLALSASNKIRIVSRNSEPLVLGRSCGCHFQLCGKHVSRIHAHIEDRDTGLFLVDRSTHRTYVCSQLRGAFHLQRTDMLLEGTGVISLGKPINYNHAELIRYSSE